MKISLVVIRCQDLTASKDFYQKLGLSFVKEKHGNGPEHYACECDGVVFELYPNQGMPPNDNVRLGFRVAKPDSIAITSHYERDGEAVYIVTDPDGRKVELTSPSF